MVTGMIEWFGGFDRQRQETNNFGFITLIKPDFKKGIYVNRREIPEDLQKILEADKEKGKGVYVSFDLSENSQKIQAINVELKTYIGVVSSFLGETGEIATKSNDSFRFKSSQSFSFGEYVCFGLRHSSKSNITTAIKVRKIAPDAEYQEIINICLNSNNSKIVTPFFLKYVNTLPSAEAIPKIREKLLYFNTEGKKLLTNKIIQDCENFLLVSSELRNNLDIDSKNELTKYSDFINKHLKNPNTNESLKQQLLDEVRERIPRATQEQSSIYWEKFAYLVEYQGFLWNIAPVECKKPIIKNLYNDFFQMVSNFNQSDYRYAQYLEEDWKELYKEVRENKDDKQLIKNWEPAINSNEFKYAQMVSARAAEKLVINFSRTFGYKVEDISIHQITKQSSDWKLGDIRLNKKTVLDVKNSRYTVNSKVYSEFCVPEFKHQRTNNNQEQKEVYIVAVLSPYLNKKFIDGEEEPHFSVEKPKILGIFYQDLIQELETIVGKNNQLKIDLSRVRNSNSYLPNWLFDYGGKFYGKQIEIIEYFQKFKAKLPDTKVPSWEHISIVGINPLPLFIVARQNLPTEWQSHLPKWQLQFINSLINIPPSPKKKIIPLSHLFISLLKHFLQMVYENNSEYTPQGYLDILYQNSQRNHPLKIYDPLQTIHSFCNTLQTLWENREKTKLTEFKIFKFRHEGILTGKKSPNDSWKTIIAYCGGKIEGKGKCGYSPLIAGIHKNCSCGLLICPEEDCQYCQQNCRSYLLRKGKNTNINDEFYSF